MYKKNDILISLEKTVIDIMQKLLPELIINLKLLLNIEID